MEKVTFDEMFVVIDKALYAVGLNGIYLKKCPYSRKFQLFQYLFYAFGIIHMINLKTGEYIYLTRLMIDQSSTNEEKFLTVAEFLPCSIASFFGLVKSLTLVFKRKIIRKLVEDFRIMWPNSEDVEINTTVSQSMIPTKQFCWVYTVVTNVLSLVYNIFPLMVMYFNYKKHGSTEMFLPYFISYPYDWTTPKTYPFTYVSQFYAGVFTTTAVSSADCLFCLMVAHLCMHFQLLCRDIRKIPFTEIKGTKLEKEIIHNRLKMVVNYHNKLIRLSRQVENIFSFVLLLTLVSSSLIICMLAFSITVSPRAKIVKYLLFLSSSITQIFMTSWYGNKLVEESEQVTSAAYNSDWTGLDCDAESRRTLCQGVLMLQTRTSRQLAISAMGFSNISLATFSSILSAAWSYFTLLRTVYDNSNE